MYHSPAPVTDSYGQLGNVALEEVVSGYHSGHEEDMKELDYITPGASMVANAQDVGVFLRALSDGSLFGLRIQA